MNAIAQQLLNLAFVVVPRKDRVWLEDMRYEAAFIDNPLPWSVSALGLALRWRLAKILATPTQLAFASAAMAAVAAILIVPNLFQPKTLNGSALPQPQAATPTQATVEATENGYVDPSLSRSAEAQALPEETTADAEFSEPTPPTLPEPSATITPAETAEAVSPTLPSGATVEAFVAPVDSEITEAEEEATFGVQFPTEESNMAEASQESMGLVPSINDTTTTSESDTNIEAMIEAALEEDRSRDVEAMQVISPFVNLKIVREVRLEVYQGTSTNELLFDGTIKAGQTLLYDLPIYVKANDGEAIQIYADDAFRGVLGKDEVEVVITQSE